jgi:hypothetical protein
MVRGCAAVELTAEDEGGNSIDVFVVGAGKIVL